jgi:hypothetical protein
VPVRFRGEPTIRCEVLDGLVRVNDKVVGVDLTGRSPAEAVALLGQQAGAVEIVVWQGAQGLPAEVIAALARLPGPRLTLLVAPSVGGDGPTDLRRLAPLRSKLSGLVVALELPGGGLAPLAGFPALEALHVASPVQPADLVDLARLPALRHLSLAGALPPRRIGPRVLLPLARLGRLATLDLSANGLTDLELAPLAALGGLRRLALGSNRIEGPGLAALAGLPALQDVDLGWNPLASLAALGRPRALRRLAAERTRLEDEGLGSLPAVASLTELDLSDTYLGDPGVRSLAALRGLRALRLPGTRVSDAGLVRLRGLAALRRLDLSRTAATAGAVELLQRALPACRVVHLGGHAAVSPLDGASSGLLGLPACDRYLQLMRCFIQQVPASARSVVTQSLTTTMQQWRQMIRNPGSRASLEQACRTAYEAAARAIAATPIGRSCLGR